MSREQIEVRLERDADGFMGRECPSCERYFKVEPGTGLENVPLCTCPYCGQQAPNNQFFTKAQVEYAKSVALHKLTSRFLKELKKLERRPDPHKMLSFGITVRGQPHPIARYTEKQLEQIVVCDSCTLRYAIYGAFGYCPDCAVHNSLQILKANFGLIEKILSLSDTESPEVASKLVENCLADAVAALDGFGREVFRVLAERSSKPVPPISFQNIENARNNVVREFNLDFTAGLTPADWSQVKLLFEKHHLLAHKMGVIDTKYLSKTGESSALLGRKVFVSRAEVSALLIHLSAIASALHGAL